MRKVRGRTASGDRSSRRKERGKTVGWVGHGHRIKKQAEEQRKKGTDR